MRIEFETGQTQRQVVESLARLIYGNLGYTIGDDAPITYLWESRHPTERMVLSLAEQILEVFAGDSPDYSDDSDDVAEIFDQLG
jgi:hypothetical protein